MKRTAAGEPFAKAEIIAIAETVDTMEDMVAIAPMVEVTHTPMVEVTHTPTVGTAAAEIRTVGTVPGLMGEDLAVVTAGD